jgi:hypothetical protein
VNVAAGDQDGVALDEQALRTLDEGGHRPDHDLRRFRGPEADVAGDALETDLIGWAEAMRPILS